MQLFVEVLAPMDQVVIGPFAREIAARAYAARVRTKGHDANVVTEEKMLENQTTYGAVPIQQPGSD